MIFRSIGRIIGKRGLDPLPDTARATNGGRTGGGEARRAPAATRHGVHSRSRF